MKKSKVLSEKRVYDGYLKIDEGVIQHGEETYSRYKITRSNAVAALLVNLDSEKIILIKQFRYPISHNESGEIIEAVAGKIDEGENPAEAIAREIEEEVGYRIPTENLEFVSELYVSPGYTTEKFHLFIAYFDETMKISKGGGLGSEHEDIDIIEFSFEEFIEIMKKGQIVDAKTFLLAQAFIIDSIYKIAKG